MSVFVHAQGLCESSQVGEGTRVWAFAHVLPGARLGKDCNICDHVFIENDVVLGDRVTVKCGVQIWDGIEIADDVFLGPNVTFTNDRFPRSRQYITPLRTSIHQGASLGANCTILPGLTIGRDAMIGAGTVVTRDVPARAIVVGNPGRIVGYVDTTTLPPGEASPEEPGTLVGDARLVRLQQHTDMRGSLVAAHFSDEIPFLPKRFFSVYDVPGKNVRGEHAHRGCHQFLVCLSGALSVLVDDGTERRQVRLDHPSLGIYVPPMIWTVHYQYSEGAVLFVLASDEYDPADYIRDYEEFLRLTVRPGSDTASRQR